MAQPSVVEFFNTRKRTAVDNHKGITAKKILVLDGDNCTKASTDKVHRDNLILHASDDPVVCKNEVTQVSLESKRAPRKVLKAKTLKDGNHKDIQELLGNMAERCSTPPNEPPKPQLNKELEKIKNKITRSSRLAELKSSISRFQESANKLKSAERRTADVAKSPQLKTFKSIELEIAVSPQKQQTPEKAYLSPRKESGVRRNLLNALTPTKNAVALFQESPSKAILESTLKPGLKLPFKYRTLAEMFRSIDTIAQILHNRKETITFRKLKPAVEEMLKRNLLPKHISQIKQIYPEAYTYQQQKLKQYGTKQEEWELVLIPNIDAQGAMTSEVLLNRRRQLFEKLIESVKNYHNEFLQSLIPPMVVENSKITRWHPEFDLEKVPEIPQCEIPQAPIEEKLITGKEVLEKARQMFSCNTRMEQALAKLQQARESNTAPIEEKSTVPTSVLKGIPKALLEKVRQRQAAKALVSMTRSVDKDKELQVYSRLPEIARLTRNLFVSEKKSVLPLDVVIEKLGNSYRHSLTKTEMEDHLKAISKEVPTWLIFHTVRYIVYLKLAKNADMSIVINKLEKLVKDKSES